MVLVLTVAHRPRGTHLGPPTPTGARPHPAAVLAAQRERESLGPVKKDLEARARCHHPTTTACRSISCGRLAASARWIVGGNSMGWSASGWHCNTSGPLPNGNRLDLLAGTKSLPKGINPQ